MELVAACLAVACLNVAGLVVIGFYLQVRLTRLEQMLVHHHDSIEKPKKILVPGRGIFSTPSPKKTPKYLSEEELWVKEQDEKR